MASDYPTPTLDRGKPAATIDCVSIAPDQGGISITVTITIGLDDAYALDMVLRAIGTIARSRGIGSAS